MWQLLFQEYLPIEPTDGPQDQEVVEADIRQARPD
jgi:hypothetical protein